MGNNELLLVLSGILGIILGKYLWGWYFEVQKRNRLMEGQILLLLKIAKQLGVDKDEVNQIVADALKIPASKNTKTN